MKFLIVALSLSLALLFGRLIFGDGSLQELHRVRAEAAGARTELLQLENRNQKLLADVEDLKTGLDAIEERARSELGMIGKDETFYQFVSQTANRGGQ